MFSPSSAAGELLQCLSPSLRADRAVVLAACAQSSSALRYASPELQRDVEVLAAALKAASKRASQR